jgi:hypothetical protein
MPPYMITTLVRCLHTNFVRSRSTGRGKKSPTICIRWWGRNAAPGLGTGDWENAPKFGRVKAEFHNFSFDNPIPNP